MFTLGADPEVFVVSRGTNRLVPVVKKLGGTKGNPRQIPGLPKGFGVQEDNVMAEFNIPPAHTAEEFSSHIRRALFGLDLLLAPKYSYINTCWGVFTNYALRSKQAKTFGCSPDYNAYAYGDQFFPVNPAALRMVNRDGSVGEYRFCGGHLHIGHDLSIPPHIMALFCDLFIGLSIVPYDKQQRRRILYGNPGRYRPTAYGLEYRTPSNYWVNRGDAPAKIASHAFGMLEYLRDYQQEAQSVYTELDWSAVHAAIFNESEVMANLVINQAHGIHSAIGDYIPLLTQHV